MVEAIIFICTVVGAFIAFDTYKKTYINKPNEEIQFLARQYSFAKELNDKIINKLSEYAEENHAYNEHFMQGITFQKCLNILQEAKDKLFNEESDKAIAETVKIGVYNKTHENLLKTIEIHIKHACEIQTYFNFYFEPESKGITD